MGRHDVVPDVLLDARPRRGGAGLWEIHGGAHAASPPGHPADRCPHYAGIGVLAVPARLRWGARRADADTDGSGIRVRRAGRATGLPAGNRRDATRDDAVHSAAAIVGVGRTRRPRGALARDSAAHG